MPDPRKAKTNRNSYIRRLIRQAEAAAPVSTVRLTANPARAATIRLASGKRIESREVPSWRS